MSAVLSEDTMRKWETMYKKYGPLGLASKMVKTPAYRAYVQKWPFDYTKPILGEDAYLDRDSGAVDIVDEVDTRIRYKEFLSLLSPRQLDIWLLYADGKRSYEIMDILGYKTTGAVRWHKHEIKKIWSKVHSSLKPLQ